MKNDIDTEIDRIWDEAYEKVAPIDKIIVRFGCMFAAWLCFIIVSIASGVEGSEWWFRISALGGVVGMMAYALIAGWRAGLFEDDGGNL